jgi:hypothetical protein
LLQMKPLTTYFLHSKAFKEVDEISQRISPVYQLDLRFSTD